VVSEFGLAVVAEHDLPSTPQLDIICVPGGPGTLDAARPKIIAFLQAQAPGAQWVTSVYTGSLLLGVAGLLQGYRATTHWLSLDLLPLVGAIPVAERVVKDRNRITTSSGVSAGIDFALTLAAELVGQRRAEAIKLMMEYNPAPPFACGHPSLADPALVSEISEERRELQAKRREFLALRSWK
jgi:cyclohexyl-isocyanide hydratase